MSASMGLPNRSAMLPALGREDFGDNRFDPARHRPGARTWRQRWERPLTWWSVIGLCSGFWYGVLHLFGAV